MSLVDDLMFFPNFINRLRKHGVDEEIIKRVQLQLSNNFLNPDYWIELAVTLRKLGNYNAAEETYKSALNIHNCHSKLLTNYAILLLHWERISDAIEVCEEALRINPDYVRAISTKGRIHELLHEYDKAIECYELALTYEPESALLKNNIGCCYIGLNDEGKAIDAFNDAIALDPEYTNALFNLSAIYIKNKNVSEASLHITTLAKLLPDDGEVKNLLRSLKEIYENRDGINESVSVSRARKRKSSLDSEFEVLMRRISGNPKSLFISYAWPNSKVKEFALRLFNDLQERGYEVVIDTEMNIDIGNLLILLNSCQNVLVINDAYYIETCLMGKVPITKKGNWYPAIAFEQNIEDESIAAVDSLAKIISKSNSEAIEDNMWPEYIESIFENLKNEFPHSRIFIEGWRMNEIQMVFQNMKNYRSFSVAYFDGGHCISGYPIFDFSSDEYYEKSLVKLDKYLNIVQHRELENGPIKLSKENIILLKGYVSKNSFLRNAKLWMESDKEVLAACADMNANGKIEMIIYSYNDWEPVE